jgi:hypothetical protein
LFKTWKISFPERFMNGNNSISVARALVNERGTGFLLAGTLT